MRWASLLAALLGSAVAGEAQLTASALRTALVSEIREALRSRDCAGVANAATLMKALQVVVDQHGDLRPHKAYTDRVATGIYERWERECVAPTSTIFRGRKGAGSGSVSYFMGPEVAVFAFYQSEPDQADLEKEVAELLAAQRAPSIEVETSDLMKALVGILEPIGEPLPD